MCVCVYVGWLSSTHSSGGSRIEDVSIFMSEIVRTREMAHVQTYNLACADSERVGRGRRRSVR